MKVVKNTVITAFELGTGHPLEVKYIEEGTIRRNGDQYEIFSSEAKGEKGEIAEKGDMVIVDCQGVPYPNKRKRFFEYYILLEGDHYVNIPVKLEAWSLGEEMNGQLKSIIDEGRLIIQEDSEEAYFKAELWGTTLTAAKNAIILFYNNEYGQDCDFNFVKREVFDETFRIIR